jgi:protein-S-isoprenylcysteine O-methyltransferase Ste14
VGIDLFVLARALTYATLFVGFLLVFVPGELLRAAGIGAPARIGPIEAAGIVLVLLGGAIALWCVLSFALLGKGTPAPFDPPRRLVRAGPYRRVRNPMYLGAGTALLGAAVYYRSPALLGYLAAAWLVLHFFVIGYEEPTLTRLFGAEYEAYRKAVPRWLPRLGRGT